MSTQQQSMKQQPIQQSMQQPVLGLPMRSKPAFPDGFFYIQSKGYPSLTMDVYDGSLAVSNLLPISISFILSIRRPNGLNK
jgi:hypothetical protein